MAAMTAILKMCQDYSGTKSDRDMGFHYWAASVYLEYSPILKSKVYDFQNGRRDVIYKTGVTQNL